MPKTILLIHGPNLNRLGKRAAEHYGVLTLEQLETIVAEEAKQFGCVIESVQSNHEGDLIDWVQEYSDKAAGIIINPGALTHYSYALHDALVDAQLPTVEVHLSDIQAREKWRSVSVVKSACIAQISGKKEEGYREAVRLICRGLN